MFTGSNSCTAGRNVSTTVCCTEGFDAVVGWDPTTGFGSINYANLFSTFGAPLVPSDEDSGLTTDQIIGISVAGGVVGAGLIGGAAYYALYSKPAVNADLKEPLGPVTQSPMV